MFRIKLFDRYPLHVAIDRATGYTAFLFCAVAFPVLYIVSRYNYNLFHSLADIFTIVIAGTIFVVAWNSRESIDNNYLLYAGIGFLSFAFLDLFHVLGNKNMGVFPQYGNLGPTLYIASRYVLSVSLVTAPLFINRKLRVAPVIAAYSLGTLLVLLSVFYWQNFPVCFVEGVGLTTFKVMSDYIICLILLGALVLLLLNRRSFDARVLRQLAASILLFIATGLAFTLYADPFGVMNAIGHFFQIISFYLIYLAVIETGLTKPQNILFRKLKQSEEKYRNLFQNMAEEVHFWQVVRGEDSQIKTWKLVDANPPTLKTWGRSTVEEIRGKTTDEIFGPGTTEHYMPVVQKIMTEGVPHSFEDYFPNLDRYFTFTSVPLGEYFITTGADVTGIKKAELAMRESEAKANAMIQYAPTGICEIDYRGPNFTSVNDAMCQILGYSREELISMGPGALLDENSRVLLADRVKRQMAGEKIEESVEYRVRKKDGSFIDTILNISLNPEGEPWRALVIVHDITERKRAEDALRKAKDELEIRVQERTEELSKSQQRLQQLASQLLIAQEKERKRVAVELHDGLLSELSATKYLLEYKIMLLEKGKLSGPDELKRVIDILANSMREARRIMNNLHPAILDELGLIAAMNWLCAEYQKSYPHIMVEKRIEVLEQDISDSVRFVIFRVLQEALNNFAKHGKGNRVDLSLSKANASFMLMIRDNGQGFDVGNAQKGLGLESMRERVEISGGTFGIESVIGQGTKIQATWKLS